MMTCNLIAPQVFWIKWARSTPWFIFLMSIIVNIGMWFERFVIIVTSLHRDFIPSSWSMYTPTIVEVSILIGSFGLFFTLYFLFCRYLPTINMAEIKSIIPTHHADQGHGQPAHGEHAKKGDAVHG